MSGILNLITDGPGLAGGAAEDAKVASGVTVVVGPVLTEAV